MTQMCLISTSSLKYIPSHEPLNWRQNSARTTEKKAGKKAPTNLPITSGKSFQGTGRYWLFANFYIF